MAPAYTVADFDARYDLTNTFGIRDAYVQVNVTNLLDEDYLGNISTGNNSFAAPISSDPRVPLRGGQTRTYSIGSPRTAMISLRHEVLGPDDRSRLKEGGPETGRLFLFACRPAARRTMAVPRELKSEARVSIWRGCLAPFRNVFA